MSTQHPQPHPPHDPEHHRTIDSTAIFVAKHGPASEEATRQQNRDNPQFAFLFGGDFYDYYKYRLLFEIQNMQRIPAGQPPPMFVSQGQGPPPSFAQLQQIPLPMPAKNPMELEEQKLEEQIKRLRNQIVDSESNLKAHEVALNSQKQAKVETLWRAVEDKRIDDLVKQVGLNIAAFDKCLERLQDSGSKDTISNSKKWIFDNCNSDRLREIILMYLLHRVRERTATDALRLHILYLINDWAHHCHRKKLDGIRQMLCRYVPKLYAYASASNGANNNNGLTEKLEKLVGVWEGHKYFDDGCFKQLRNPTAILTTEQASAVAEQQKLSAEVDKEIADTLGGYTKQHKEYEQHMLSKIGQMEVQLKDLRDKIEADRERRLHAEEQRAEEQRSVTRRSRFDQQVPSQQKIPSLFDSIQQSPVGATPGLGLPAPDPPGPQQQHFPPAQPTPKKAEIDFVPKAPYYELPAGMIVPLVRLEDFTYKPLREQDLRLPPPEPPSELLLREIDRFYSALQLPPPIDCIRDADGWEMNGLIEHYVKKGEQRIRLEAKLKKEGKTLEEVFTNKFVPTAQKSEKTEDTNGEKSESKERTRSSSTSSTSSSSSNNSSSSSSGSSGSSSPTKSPKSSPSPALKRRRRSRSATPEERPCFAVPLGPASKSSAISFKIPPNPLNRETNKGAQLMAKMGWEGKGLGAKEQGIEEPVTGGEVRDKTEQYRGLGSKPDIYDEYRKQMSTQMAKRLHKF